ncbi:MAG: PIN domain-containing protein [Flavobacteriaceae bacterium]|jgi:predicted nucleic-acid-binding protein|nr:PIN domain-containing protein [Flavobacteriaceae bacterium]
MVIFDANVILRIVLRDHPAMVEEAKKRLSSDVCFVPVEVVAEIVYVLSKVYGVERTLIAQTMADVANVNNIVVAQQHVVLHALRVYASTAFDFVDCLLIGYAREDKYDVFTFDKKLRNFLKD